MEAVHFALGTFRSPRCAIAMTTVLSSHLWEKEAVRCITLATIKKATDDFSSERVIGRGAFAKVYEVCTRARSAPRTTPSILLASLLYSNSAVLFLFFEEGTVVLLPLL